MVIEQPSDTYTVKLVRNPFLCRFGAVQGHPVTRFSQRPCAARRRNSDFRIKKNFFNFFLLKRDYGFPMIFSYGRKRTPNS